MKAKILCSRVRQNFRPQLRFFLDKHIQFIVRMAHWLLKRKNETDKKLKSH